jgi:hypothetical protein
MTERILGTLVFAALFVIFGLMSRRLGNGGCSGGACGGECGPGQCGTDHQSSPHGEEKNPAGWWAS